MAGSYPNVPGRRMPWDADGTVATIVTTDSAFIGPISAAAELNATKKAELNDEDVVKVTLSEIDAGNFGWFALIFPELREIDGISVGGNAGANMYQNVSTSADSTDGIAGTWATAIADVHTTTTPSSLTDYRDFINSMSASSRRALRISRHVVSGFTNPETKWVHVYGEISPGQTPDKILIIDNTTGVEFTAAVDYGDIPRGSSEDKEVRLRNDSATLQANNVQYTAESLYESSGDWYTMTLPGAGVYQATQQLAAIGAATTTGIITLRRITPGAEGLSLHAARFKVNVDTWT